MLKANKDVELEESRQHATRHAYDYAVMYVGDEWARHYANYYSAQVADDDEPDKWPSHSVLYWQWYQDRYLPQVGN